VGLELTGSVLEYTTGLVIALLLLIILWSLLKLDKDHALPRFCDDCINLRYRAFSTAYCKMRCKYHPAYRYSYVKSFYKKRAR